MKHPTREEVIKEYGVANFEQAVDLCAHLLWAMHGIGCDCTAAGMVPDDDLIPRPEWIPDYWVDISAIENGETPMKEEELRQSATCAVCKKPFGHTQLPLFWRVRIRRYAVNVKAIRRQDGLAALLGGNSVIASVMGPDEDLAEAITDVEITICEKCAGECQYIPFLAEAANE